MSNFYAEKWNKPYLTPSIAKVIIERTPFHAKLACPFYGVHKDVSSDAMNEGRIVDCLVLGGDPGVTVLDVDDYRTKEARKLRDEAENPIKRADYDRCDQSARVVMGAIASTNVDAANALYHGRIKERFFWFSNDVACSTEPDIQCKYDVFDLKRTKVIPTGHNWRRHASNMRYDIQAAAAMEATGANRFGWIIIEADPPHCVVVHHATDAFIKVGQRDWDYAKQVWKNCIESDHFPAYGSEEIDPMPWLISDDGDDITFTEEAG